MQKVLELRDRRKETRNWMTWEGYRSPNVGVALNLVLSFDMQPKLYLSFFHVHPQIQTCMCVSGGSLYFSLDSFQLMTKVQLTGIKV